MAKKQKVLSYEELKKLDKKNDEIETIDIQGYPVKINKVFRPSKIKVLIAEFASIIDELKERGVDIENTNNTAIGLSLILKHFTSLEIPSDFDVMIEFYNALEDNHFLYPIISSFDENEIVKINEALKNVSENLSMYIKLENDEEFESNA